MRVPRIDEIPVWGPGDSRSDNSKDLVLAQSIPTSIFKIIIAVM